MLDTVESKLPRVTGISLPKLRKRHDAVEETLYVNQPPPTPVDISLCSLERNKFEALHGEQLTPTEPIINEEVHLGSQGVEKEIVPTEEVNKQVDTHKEVTFADRVASIVIDDAIKELENEQQVLIKEESANDDKTKETSEVTVEKEVEVDTHEDIKANRETIINEEMSKYEELDSQEVVDDSIIDKVVEENAVSIEEDIKERDNTKETGNTDKTVIDDNVVFFVTEDQDEKGIKVPDDIDKNVDSSSESDANEEEEAVVNSNGENIVKIENVIRVEVTENEKKVEEPEPDKAITSDDFPFTQNKENDDTDFMV